MRRTKEDALQTAEKVLSAGFQCFLSIGYERTTLALVAQKAGVTRGAVYGHFENKEKLYRAVLEYTFPHFEFWREVVLPAEMPLPERLTEAFWFALDNNPSVEFMSNIIALSRTHEEFRDLEPFIQKVKNELWDYIDTEVKHYLYIHGKACAETDDITSNLALLFEGMFISRVVNTKIRLDKASILRYTRGACALLLYTVEPEAYASLFALPTKPNQEE